jgi:hypothetical protein
MKIVVLRHYISDLSGGGFAGSPLRQILFAVYKTSEEDDPRPGLDYLK